MRTNNAFVAILLTGLALGLTGCETVQEYSLTYRLWDNSDLKKWNEPAVNPNLALFEDTNRADVLVCYDALSEKRSAVRAQAYYLKSNQARIAAKKKPKFVVPSAAGGLKSIPVLSAAETSKNLLPRPSAYAITTAGGRGFTLYKTNTASGPFALPVYVEASCAPARVVLTPLAMAGDTVMVGVVGSVAGFFWWMSSGAPGVNHH